MFNICIYIEIFSSYICFLFQLNFICTILIFIFIFFVLVLLGLIDISPGALPLIDEHTWKEVWEHLFWKKLCGEMWWYLLSYQIRSNGVLFCCIVSWWEPHERFSNWQLEKCWIGNFFPFALDDIRISFTPVKKDDFKD